jgi:sialate O-acetylesterase
VASAEAVAHADGRWLVRLRPLSAGGPYVIAVRGTTHALAIHRVLFGDVWVCGGQSNMWWEVWRAKEPARELADAEYPRIRVFRVRKAVAARPQSQLYGFWQASTADKARDFSAIAFFFARALHKELDVPFGMIVAAEGGATAEAWTPPHALETLSPAALEKHRKAVAEYPQKLAELHQKLEAYLGAMERAEELATTLPALPKVPADPRSGDCRPAGYYNAMIAPLTRYPIRGVLWYQGESNAGRYEHYHELFTALIRGWRAAWGQGDFPFLYAQLSAFSTRQTRPEEGAWARIRGAQLRALSEPNTAMVVTLDTYDGYSAHPLDKQEIARRFVLAAKALAYGRKDVGYSGPLYESMRVEAGKAIISFLHAAGGLRAGKPGSGEELRGFAIAGSDREFVWAEAEIRGDKVVVRSPRVRRPAAVRYAWGYNPIGNLTNATGLPASPFRTDDWPWAGDPEKKDADDDEANSPGDGASE